MAMGSGAPQWDRQGRVTILTATAWKSNAELLADVATLGYLNGRVLDCTWGLGVFWKSWQPKELVACDKDPTKAPPGGVVADFRNLPFPDESFDTVVIDPPYKLNGTPTPEVDNRYGVDVVSSWQDRHALIRDGITECARIVRRRGYVLLKCQDQVCSGRKRWQTIAFSIHAATEGLDLVDRFDMLVTPRPQPEGRRQIHSQGNYSTLLIFQKEKSA